MFAHFSRMALPSENLNFTDEGATSKKHIRELHAEYKQLTIPITKHEIHPSIKQLKLRKATDINHLTAEHLLSASSSVAKFL